MNRCAIYCNASNFFALILDELKVIFGVWLIHLSDFNGTFVRYFEKFDFKIKFIA